jgi:hypothetical protein
VTAVDMPLVKISGIVAPLVVPSSSTSHLGHRRSRR